MQLGPVRFAVSYRDVGSQPNLQKSVIIRDTLFQPRKDNAQMTIQQWYAALASDERRNTLILDDVIGALAEGRSIFASVCFSLRSLPVPARVRARCSPPLSVGRPSHEPRIAPTWHGALLHDSNFANIPPCLSA